MNSPTTPVRAPVHRVPDDSVAETKYDWYTAKLVSMCIVQKISDACHGEPRVIGPVKAGHKYVTGIEIECNPRITEKQPGGELTPVPVNQVIEALKDQYDIQVTGTLTQGQCQIKYMTIPTTIHFKKPTS